MANVSKMRAARLRGELTQTQVAHAAKVGERTVQRFEDGDIPITVLAAIRIARAVGASVEELFGESDEGTHRLHPAFGRPRAERVERASAAPTAPDAAR